MFSGCIDSQTYTSRALPFLARFFVFPLVSTSLFSPKPLLSTASLVVFHHGPGPCFSLSLSAVRYFSHYLAHFLVHFQHQKVYDPTWLKSPSLLEWIKSSRYSWYHDWCYDKPLWLDSRETVNFVSRESQTLRFEGNKITFLLGDQF